MLLNECHQQLQRKQKQRAKIVLKSINIHHQTPKAFTGLWLSKYVPFKTTWESELYRTHKGYGEGKMNAT